MFRVLEAELNAVSSSDCKVSKGKGSSAQKLETMGTEAVVALSVILSQRLVEGL
jgi:hypothetical protein